MNKKEIEELINERIKDTKYWKIVDFVIWIIIGGMTLYIAWFIVDTFRHNSDVDYHNEKLQFCKDIYKSDNVVLEQCKDYFVIVEKGSDK